MTTSAFEQMIRQTVAEVNGPLIRRALIETAKAGLTAQMGAANLPPASRIVDGRVGAPEEAVKPFGVIEYQVDPLADAAPFALERAEQLSPEDSGRYRKAWFFMLRDGTRLGSEVPPGVTEIILTNDEPYHRRLVVNNVPWHVPPGIVERVRQEVQRRFGNSVQAEIEFIALPGGYVLKGRSRRIRSAQNRRSSAYRAGRRYLAARKDTAAGQPMTYPSLVLRAR